MADNVRASAGTNDGAVFKTDDDGTAHWPYAKVAWGADNTQTPVAAGAAALPIADGGNSITVDGTVAATQSGTWNVTNAGTFAVQASLSAAIPAGTNNIGDMDVASIAAGDNNIGNVDIVTVPADPFGANADAASATGSISAKLRFIAATGIPITSIAAGTNAIGKLAANSGVDIGDVDVTTVGAITPGTGAANLGKAEDAAHASGDTGVMALAVRQDSDASLSSATGDYSPLQVDANGYLKVNIKAGAGSGGTATTDDGAFTAASGSGTPMMGFATSDSVDSGDVGVVKMLTNRQLCVTIFDSSGTELTPATQYAEDAVAASGDNGTLILAVRRDAASSGVSADGDYAALSVDSNGALRVVGGTAATQYTEDAASTGGESLSLAGAVRRDTAASSSTADGDYSTLNTDASGRLWTSAKIDTAIPAGTNNIGDVDVLTVPADPFGANADAASATGSISAKLRFIASTGIPVTGTVTVGSHPVTNAGTFAVQESGTHIQADDAAFTPATSKVAMAGFTADETATDSVDEGDGGAARMTLDRKQIVTVQPHSAGGCSIYRSLDLDEGALEVVKASPGTLYGMWVCNKATAVRYIKFYDATSGTAGTGTPVLTIGIPGNSADNVGANFNVGGLGIAFATGISFGCTTGIADNDTGAPGTNDVLVNVFYK